MRQEVIEDVLEAVKALRAQPVIEPTRVFVLGHSLGGTLIPRIGIADPTIAGLIAGAPASYWLDLRGYDPPSEATRVKAPMLILQGERDFQVTTEEFARWKAALGSRRDVTFRSYPALNHLFIAGTGASLPAEYQVPGHVAEEVIRDIATWIMTSR